MIEPFVASSLVILFEPENTHQFRLINDTNSRKMNEFFIKGLIPITLYTNKLLFRDSNKSFKLDGDLLKTMANYDFNVSHSNAQDQKLFFEFGKEMNFNKNEKGQKTNRDKIISKLLTSLAIMASVISNTKFLPSDPDYLCDRSTLLLQKKKLENNLI